MMASIVPPKKETRLVEIVCAVVLKGGNLNTLLQPNFISSKLTSSITNKVLWHLSSYHYYSCSLSWPFFNWLQSVPNYKHSLSSSWTMIHILTKLKCYRPARMLLEKIALKGFLSSPSVLNNLLRHYADPDVNSQAFSWLVIFYANSKMAQDAIQVFEHMSMNCLKPHLPSCTVLLNSLVKEGMTDTAWKLHKKMILLGVVPNIHIYNVLVHACCKSGDVEKAEKVLCEMDFKSIFPDLCTYNTLISLYCNKGMHYEALCVQDRMERAKISPDIVTYNSLINVFCKEGKMREAVRFFQDIKGATPNHVTYTTLIDGFCRANNFDEAFRLCEVMKTKGLYPGVVTYNSILRKFCEEGRLRDANKLLNEMSQWTIKPDTVTCNTLINAYGKIGDMASAVKVKQKMLDVGLKLDRITYGALIHGFCKAREIESAEEVLFGMLDAGFSPSYYSYSWIVDGYCCQGNEGNIVKLPNEFEKRGLCVDISLYRAVIRRLCKIGKVDCARKMFLLMQERGILGDSVVYANLAWAYFKDGNGSDGLNMLAEMVSRRLMITFELYRSLNDSKTGDRNVLGLFWDQVMERGLMSRKTQKYIQQMKVTSEHESGVVSMLL